MLKFAFSVDGKAPIGVVAICEENVLLMKAGKPLEIDIKSITPPNTRINKVYVHYAPTYEDAVNDLRDEGMPVDQNDGEMMKRAKELDAQIKRDRRVAGGRSS